MMYFLSLNWLGHKMKTAEHQHRNTHDNTHYYRLQYGLVLDHHTRHNQMKQRVKRVVLTSFMHFLLPTVFPYEIKNQYNYTTRLRLRYYRRRKVVFMLITHMRGLFIY